MVDSIEVQLIAPINIALIKYWGKADEENIIPINDSISITISPTALSSLTTITMSPTLTEDCLFINGEKHPISHRLKKVIEILKNRTQGYYLNNKSISKEKLVSMHFKADSTNSFPTAAGLASSASGLCALGKTITSIWIMQNIWVKGAICWRNIHYHKKVLWKCLQKLIWRICNLGMWNSK
jgi:diphosphomevalonate decarboxylase